MSQSGSLNNGGSGPIGPNIEQINGDTGSITGNIVTIYANNAANNSGATVEFVNSGTVSTIDVTDTKNNTFVGKLSGNLTRSPVLCSNNTSLGYGSLAVANTTNQCTAIGFSALSNQTGGQHQTAVGATSLANSVSSNQNSALGAGSGNSNIDGNDNCYFGFNAAEMMPHGSSNTVMGSKVAINILGTANNNTIIGYQAGNNYVLNESSNVLISNAGVANENNVIRIGTQGTGAGQQDECFIAGITGVTAVGSPVAVSSTGELSDLGFGTATQVLTSNGAGVSPTWQAAGGGGSATGFMAYANATLSNVTGNGVIYNVIFNSTTRNDGTAYSTSTGLYTAAKTGLYSFSTTLFLQSGSSFTAGSEVLVASKGSVQSQIICLYGAAASAQVNAAIIVAGNWTVQMTAGDTINVQAFSNSTLQDVSITGNPLSPNQFTTVSCFSGFYLGS